MRNALRYACRRAQHTNGHVALLHVIEPVEFQHWLGVGRVLEERRPRPGRAADAEAGERGVRADRHMPVIHIREGKRAEQLVALLQEDPSISLLVLATASGAAIPGPLVTFLLGHLGKRVKVPVTLVPGELTLAEIDLLS